MFMVVDNMWNGVVENIIFMIIVVIVEFIFVIFFVKDVELLFEFNIGYKMEEKFIRYWIFFVSK